MIRYVLAVALVVAVLAVAAVGIDSGATARGEAELSSAVERVDAAAVELYERETLALAGGPAPQRVVEVTLPGEGETSQAPARVTFRRVAEEQITLVTYRFPGRAEHSHLIEAPVVRAGEGQFRLDGPAGRVTLRLRLVSDSEGRPVVALAVDR